MDMVEKVARAMMAVTASLPGDPNGDTYPVLAMDPDYDDLPRNETEGTADDEITQAAVLALARAAIGALKNERGVCPDHITRAIGQAMEREGMTNISIDAIWAVWNDGIDAALAPKG